MGARVLAGVVAAVLGVGTWASMTAGVAWAQPSELPPPPLPPPGTEPPSRPSQPPQPHQPAPPPPPPQAPPRRAPPPRAAPPPYEDRVAPADTPLPRRGFQIGIRAGAALPLGETAANQGLGETWGPQFITWLDIGGKPIPHLFIGGYFASGIGGISDDFAGCGGNRTCTGYNFRVGAQIQYHFEPAAKADPWIGYGIGWEVAVVDSSGPRGVSTSTVLGGPELAHFMGGLDFRLSRTFGVGPYGDFALGTYTTTDNGSINDTALHQWLILGAKFTFFP